MTRLQLMVPLIIFLTLALLTIGDSVFDHVKSIGKNEAYDEIYGFSSNKIQIEAPKYYGEPRTAVFTNGIVVWIKKDL